jgi:hypothetical protein
MKPGVESSGADLIVVALTESIKVKQASYPGAGEDDEA